MAHDDSFDISTDVLVTNNWFVTRNAYIYPVPHSQWCNSVAEYPFSLMIH